MNDIARLRQQLLATAMVAGSLCVWAGHLGSYDSTQSPAAYVAQIATHHTRFVLGELLIAIGAFLLIPAMAGLMRLTPARGSRLTTIGGILAGVALAGLGAGNLMFGVVLGMLTPAHNDLATEVVRIANDAPLAGVPFIPAPLLTIGLILVGVGLLRAGAVPKALAAALIVGAVLVVPSGGGGRLTVALLAPMCLSLMMLGAILARRTHVRGQAVVVATPSVSV
jgi:hypothetical protein